jgi:hypothetical protein
MRNIGGSGVGRNKMEWLHGFIVGETTTYHNLIPRVEPHPMSDTDSALGR